jgi:hypothetical protein
MYQQAKTRTGQARFILQNGSSILTLAGFQRFRFFAYCVLQRRILENNFYILGLSRVMQKKWKIKQSEFAPQT